MNNIMVVFVFVVVGVLWSAARDSGYDQVPGTSQRAKDKCHRSSQPQCCSQYHTIFSVLLLLYNGLQRNDKTNFLHKLLSTQVAY